MVRRQNLLEWCAQNAVEIDTRLGIENDRVTALDFILRDTVVARVPKEAVLSLKTSTISAQLSSLPLTPVVALSLALLYEMEQGSQSPWYLYIQSLPSAPPDVASLWSRTPDLNGTEMGKRLAELSHAQNGLRGRMSRRRLEEIYQQHSKTLSIHSPLSSFLYAYAVVSSRVFSIDTYHDVGLVPIADLFNHVEESNIAIESDLVVCECCGQLRGTCIKRSDSSTSASQSQTLDIVTTSTAESAEELYNSYGDALSNVDLALEYGFVLDANESDRVTFEECGSVSAETSTKDATLDDDEQELFVADRAAYIDAQGRVSLGLFGVHETNTPNAIVSAYEQSEIVSDASTRQMISQLIDKIDKRIAQYPSQITSTTPMLMQMREDELGLLQTARHRFTDLL
ncbi:hypothetical protein E3P99_01108 [Wallemia hederae]|uniref:Uncharacterized protein n=1 Tax=Wallemia hederae TaxID=1540922 RepID=A0A4T0FRY2_9BASI|nr:hypothetical protein E3P99_01108 [Wallemia hederae]